jgi:DNA primase
LDREVYPVLFDRLDRAFPEYGFRRKAKHWEATADATRVLPGSPRPERVCCYVNRPWGLVIQGGSFVRFLDLVNGGTKPSGSDFPEAVRKLAGLAGVAVPEREVSPEEAERQAKLDARRSALETVAALCQETLRSDAGKAARAYLEARGLDAASQELGLGLYPAVREVEKALRAAGHDVEAARAEGLLFAAMADYAVFPWADAAGQPMTLYGRWPAKTPPSGKPKTLALPGEGTKASPLYFDRARRAGLKDLVLVEGLIDAALLQANGEAGVIACMGSQFSASQLETLDRYGVRSVTICLDPDGAGETGTLACIHGLYDKGINAFVTPVLPDGKDPDEYVRAHGLDAWREHIGRAEHGFRFKARATVKTHRGKTWTDRSLAACLDEAIAFDAAVNDPERLTDLSQFFWPEIIHATGADLDAINARRGAARDRAEQERERLAYDKLLRKAGDKLRGGDLAGTKELLHEETDRLRTEERHWQAEPVRNVGDELGDHEERLARWRGREFIGLPQRTLPKLDELTLGLRGLMLLAAAPNVGKTALAIQLGLDAVVHNQDAAFLFISLEMSRWDMLTRFRSRLSGLDWKTLVFGSGRGDEASFTNTEFQKLDEAHNTLRDIGGRLRILDDKNFPAPTLENILDQVGDLKASSGARRVIVAVDYLQVWPVPDTVAKHLRTDLDADKWRIGQMKELRDAVGSENATLVISEARKPSNDAQEWAGDMAAVMGAARGTYTPDMVLLLNPLLDKELGGPDDKNGDAGKKQREQDAEAGFARQRLSIVKGRDGVQRGRLDLRFHFRQSRFEEI